MRLIRVRTAFAGVFVCLAGVASAQQASAVPAPPPPMSDLNKLNFKSAAEVAAEVKKIPNDVADKAYNVFRLPGYAINAAHRSPVSQIANQHMAQNEFFYVLDGAATLITGGRIVGGKQNGTNTTGPSIEGGTRQKMAKGDWLIVPAGVPHQFADIAPAGVNLLQMYLPVVK